MKRHFRRIAAVVLAAVFIFSSVPAEAAPRDRDRDLPNAIVRVIKKIQKLFGGGPSSQEEDNQPLPPRPGP